MKTCRLLFALALLAVWPGVVCGGDEPKPVDVAGFSEPIRVACIGDSITKGVAADRPLCYASLIGNALGAKWVVTNLGVTGATLLKKGDKSYFRLAQYQQALQLKPDVATIALGTNDSKPQNWCHKEEFEADYKSMIGDLRQANPKVIIYCCVPPPVGENKWAMSGAVVKDEIGPLVRKVAKDGNCGVIDLYAALEGKEGCVPDNVHPNNAGHKWMAIAVFRALTGKALPEEAVPAAAPVR